MGFSITAQSIEHWQLWNNLPTATSSVLVHEIHSGRHLQHVNHPPVATESETSRRNLSPSAMKARTLASGAPSETTHSLQFPTHTFNLLALMQMLLRAEKAAALSLCELTSLSKQNRNFIGLFFMPALLLWTMMEQKVVTSLLLSIYSTRETPNALLEEWSNAEDYLDSHSFHWIMQLTVDLWRWLICLYIHQFVLNILESNYVNSCIRSVVSHMYAHCS